MRKIFMNFIFGIFLLAMLIANPVQVQADEPPKDCFGNIYNYNPADWYLTSKQFTPVSFVFVVTRNDLDHTVFLRHLRNEEGLTIPANLYIPSTVKGVDENGNEFSYQVQIDLGDANPFRGSAGNTCRNILQHVFIDPGVEVVGGKKDGVMDWGAFDGNEELVSVDMTDVDMAKVTSFQYAFRFCKKLQDVAFGINIQNITSTDEMFRACESLKEMNLSGLDLHNVTSTKGMFAGCSSIERINLSGQNMDALTEMENMFLKCNSLVELWLPNGMSNATVYAKLPKPMRCDSTVYLEDTPIDASMAGLRLIDTQYCKVGFSVKKDQDVSYTIVGKNTKLTKPTEVPVWEGHEFGGWYKDGIYDDEHRWDFDNDTVTSDMTLYAKWMCTVVFYYNNGSGTDSREVPYGAKIEIQAPPEWEHHTFAGWYRDEGLTQKWDPDTDIVDGNISLYAKWLQNYTVTFKTNGGSTIEPIEVGAGNRITGIEDPTKEHYAFEGWYKDEALSKKWNLDSDTVKENITLHAKWLKIYTVTFETNSESLVNSQEIVEGKAVSVPDAPTKAHYVFEGWQTKDKQDWDFESDTVLSDITLYARWSVDFKDDKDKDKDGLPAPDGLPAAWEIDGVDTDDDGVIDLHIEEMGADPNVPDIFVEVDWMERPGYLNGNNEWQPEFSLKPEPYATYAMEIVYNSFKNRGINLHIDAGPDSVDFVTGTQWGRNSGGGVVGYKANFNTKQDWVNYKNNYFSKNRELVFRHCLFINKYDGCSSTGKADNIPGQFFLVACQDGDKDGDGIDDGGFTLLREGDIAIAGTFMHELGHTLGLGHAGFDHAGNFIPDLDNSNNTIPGTMYKPNYLSVMNYAFQLRGMPGQNDTHYITYSLWDLPDLNENQLDENKGIDPNSVTNNAPGIGTYIYNRGTQDDVDSIPIIPIAGSACDYDGDGTFNNSVSQDINGDGDYTVLEGTTDDWSKIKYKGGDIGKNLSSAGANAQSEAESVYTAHELDTEDVFKYKLLGKEGNGSLEAIGPYLLPIGKANQAVYVRISNMSHADNTFLLKVDGSDINDPIEKKVHINGSISSISYADIEIPIVNVLGSGSYNIHATISYEGKEVRAIDIPVTLSDISDDDIDYLIKHRSETTLPDVVFDEYEEIKTDVRVDELYTIEYNLNGGKVFGNPSKYNSGSNDIVLIAPTKTNAEFIGWTGSNGDVPQKEVMIKKGTTGDLHFVANWEWVENPIDPDIPDNPPEGIWFKGLKASYPYTGSAIKPEFKVYRGKTRLYLNTDYTLQYKNNTKPGTATITIKMKGNYSGSKDVTFKIDPAALGTDVTADTVYLAYKNNKLQKPKPELYINGTKLKYGKNDLTITYPSEAKGTERPYVDPGTYKIHIAAKNTNMFKGEMDVDLVIAEKPLMKDVSVKASKNSLPYNNGNAVSPVFTLTYKGKAMAEGTDYTVSYADDHTDIGKHKVTFIGNNKDYFGKKTVTFSITGKYDLTSDKAEIKLDAADLNPDGSAPFTYGGAKPGAVVRYNGVKLAAGKDYTISYANNKNLGTATATIKGKGSYTGSVPKEFAVKARDINSINMNLADVLYSAKKDAYKKTSVVFVDKNNKDQKMKLNTDYTLSIDGDYGDAPAAGTEIKVIIQGKGNYTGTINNSYRIIDSKYDFTKAKIVVNDGKPYDYTGDEIKPLQSELKVTLNNTMLGTDDYEISGYYNNIKKGNSAYIKLRGKGKYAGIQFVKFKIGAAPIERIWSDTILSLKSAFAW